MFPDDIVALAEQVIDAARSRGIMVATAESCTGGMVGGALTAVSGSSHAVDRGFVTYSNAAKIEMLGVSKSLIESAGAVSEPVARAMADGALSRSDAAVVVSITGIAGPTGGTAIKPVGTVHFGVAETGQATFHRLETFGDIGRERVREASVRTALRLLLEAVKG